ncbi:MAG: 4Fe-4S binding protein [Peptococcaceae bacterium]|nr:4Fe-4S binding protein [Peptococcaceae bacterium]
MSAFVLDKLCKGCQRCVRACPEGAISMALSLAVVEASKCTECETCMEACMHGAITLVQDVKEDLKAIQG